MITQGLFGFFNQFLSLSLLHAVLYIYIFFFGIVVLILEGRGPFYPISWKRHIQTQAKFLTLLNGRGASYAFMGTVLCILPGLGSVLLGLFMIALGGTMFLLGQHAKTKVRANTVLSTFAPLYRYEKFVQPSHNLTLNDASSVGLCEKRSEGRDPRPSRLQEALQGRRGAQPGGTRCPL